MASKDFKSISLDDIAAHSPWPARLTSVEEFSSLKKTSETIKQEFGNEKWGSLLNHFSKKKNFTLDEVVAKEQDPKEQIACFDNSKGFFLTEAGLANKAQLSIYESALKKELGNAHGLVELGAGYGAKILGLSDRPIFKNKSLYAAEYTSQGSELIKMISSQLDRDISVGRCDFHELKISNIKIPENSVIFTSYSVHYLPTVSEKFVEFLLSLKPKAVFHFEPCYECYSPDSIYGLMCMRYIELNGYTKNIASQIKASCMQVGAKFDLEKNVFGSNPFLPFSIIKWIPRY